MTPVPPSHGDGISDETLMMFADGALDDRETDRIAAAIEADPALQQRVAAFLATRHGLKGAFSAVINERPPERLFAAARGEPARRDDTVVAFRQRARPAGAGPQRWAPLAIAAAVAGVAAGLAGYMLGQSVAAPPHAVAALASARPEVLAGLATIPDGQRRALDGVLMVEVSGSYRMGDRRICRTLMLEQTQTGTAAEGVACAGPQGWRVELALPREPTAGPYRPATGAGPIDALLDAGGAREAMSASEVEALIRQGWR